MKIKNIASHKKYLVHSYYALDITEDINPIQPTKWLIFIGVLCNEKKYNIYINLESLRYKNIFPYNI